MVKRERGREKVRGRNLTSRSSARCHTPRSRHPSTVPPPSPPPSHPLPLPLPLPSHPPHPSERRGGGSRHARSWDWGTTLLPRNDRQTASGSAGCSACKETGEPVWLLPPGRERERERERKRRREFEGGREGGRERERGREKGGVPCQRREEVIVYLQKE